MEEAQEEPRLSMYDVSKEIREQKFPVSRVMYIAKLNTEDRQHKFELNDEMNRWRKDSDAEVTFLMILSGTSIMS